MSAVVVQRGVLTLASLALTGVGALLLLAPQMMHASIGVTLGSEPSLLSEIRAPGAGLIGAGGLAALGVLRAEWRGPSMIIGGTTLMAFAMGRGLSLLIDGWPAFNLIWAGGVEFALGSACLAAAYARKWATRPMPEGG